MTSTYQYQNQNGQGLGLEGTRAGLELIQKIHALIHQIEAQSAQSCVLYGEELKVLLAEPRLILNIVEQEYNAASSVQKRKLLCGLEDKLKGFHRTLISCKKFMEVINGRWTLTTIVYRKHDLKMMKEHHEEVKDRGEEIVSRITLLKTPWLDLLSLDGVVESSSSLRERQPTPSTTVPTVSPTRQTASLSTQPDVMMPNSPYTISDARTTTTHVVSSPTHSFTHASIRDSPFQSAGKDIHSRTVFDHSYRNTILHVHGDYVVNNYGEERGERIDKMSFIV